MTLGNRLRNLREDADLRQSDIAKEVNVLQASISNYELDLNAPDLDILVKLANLYNVNIDYLLGNTDNKLSWKDFEKILIISGEKLSGTEIIDKLNVLDNQEKEYIIGLIFRLAAYHNKNKD